MWLTAFFCESERLLQNLVTLIALTVVFGLEWTTLHCLLFNSNNHHSGDNWKEQKNKSVQVLNAEPPWPKPLWVIQRLKTVSHAMLLSLPITAKYFRRHTITFGYAAERWFRQELVGTDIPCWPNYYSLLCCHIRSSSKTTGLSVPASSGDGDEHRLALWSWLSRNVSWTGWSANRCQMFVSLFVARDFCQYIPLWISADERWIIFDRRWQNLTI